MTTDIFQSYLVTGGCGLLGQHIIKQLRSTYPDAPIAVFDLVQGDNQDEGVRYFVGDITDRNALENVVKEVSFDLRPMSPPMPNEPAEPGDVYLPYCGINARAIAQAPNESELRRDRECHIGCTSQPRIEFGLY